MQDKYSTQGSLSWLKISNNSLPSGSIGKTGKPHSTATINITFYTYSLNGKISQYEVQEIKATFLYHWEE